MKSAISKKGKRCIDQCLIRVATAASACDGSVKMVRKLFTTVGEVKVFRINCTVIDLSDSVEGWSH